MSRMKKSKLMRSQARETINCVTEFCEKEAENNSLQMPLTSVQKRAATAAGVSVTTVRKVRRHFIQLEDNPSGGGIFPKYGRKIRRARHRRAYLNDLGKSVIRHAINEFYIGHKRAPNCETLLALLKERIDFLWRRESFRKVLYSMDYRWWRSGTRKLILVEKSEMIASRNRYLRAMKKYRGDQRVIVYVGEMWIDSELTFRNYWKKCSTSGAPTSVDPENRLLFVHAGTVHGFVPNAELVYETGSNTGDYCGPMDYLNFEKWLREKLLPNIPPHSVICMNSAPHHTTQADPVPSKYSTKRDMVSWLEDKNVTITADTRKSRLFELIQQHAPETVAYRVDRMVNEAGHDVIRTPSHHGDLNAIEFVFSEVEKFIKEKSGGGMDLSIPSLQGLLFESFKEIGPKLWREFCLHVERLEDKYWETDGQVEDIMDEIILKAGAHVEDVFSDESSSEMSSSDGDSIF